MEFTASMKNNYEFRRLYSKGRFASTPLMAVYVRKNRTRRNKLGLTVSTKLGNAVVRNRIRRRLREIYRLHEQEILPGFDIVVVGRSAISKADYHRMETDFLRLAEKLGLKADMA